MIAHWPTCRNCRMKDLTVTRRRVAAFYNDVLCATCHVDACRAHVLADAQAVRIGGR